MRLETVLKGTSALIRSHLRHVVEAVTPGPERGCVECDVIGTQTPTPRKDLLKSNQ